MIDRVFDPNGDIALIMKSRPEHDRTSEGSTPMESGTESTPVQEKVELDVRMLVSSKHLILASSVFEAMLQDRFKEGQALRFAGCLELPLPDDDPVAFSILLDVIHGHTRKVPRKVDFHLLMHIAILVDKYQLQEVVEVFSNCWVQALQREVPKNLTDGLIPWLCIFWVFENSDKFKHMTQIMERESDGTIGAEDLPIPPAVLDTIENKRQKAISDAICTLKSLIEDYQNPAPQCTCDTRAFQCDAMVLGALIKGSMSIGLWPPPALPFIGVSFSHLSEQIREMRVPTMCEPTGRVKRSSLVPISMRTMECCGIRKSIEASLRSLEDQLCGLEFSNFKAERWLKPPAFRSGAK